MRQHYANLQWEKTVSISSKANNFNKSSVKNEPFTDWWKNVQVWKVQKYYWQMHHLVQIVHTEY